jgi:hypothetical protein
MSAAFYKVVRKDAPSHRVRKFSHVGFAGRLLVENCLQFRSLEKDLVRSVFSLVKLPLHLRLLRPVRADRLWPTATAVGKRSSLA